MDGNFRRSTLGRILAEVGVKHTGQRGTNIPANQCHPLAVGYKSPSPSSRHPPARVCRASRDPAEWLAGVPLGQRDFPAQPRSTSVPNQEAISWLALLARRRLDWESKWCRSVAPSYRSPDGNHKCRLRSYWTLRSSFVSTF